MATQAQVQALIKAHYQNDGELFRSVALQIQAHERSLGRDGIAASIERIMGKVSPTMTLTKLPSGRDRDEHLFDVIPVVRKLDDLVLSESIRTAVDAIIRENVHAQLLRQNSLRPINRVLFHGPPGRGKTATAEAIAGELNLPFLIARHDTLISSYLGETAGNFRKAFKFAEAEKCVVLFDEFDALGKQRTSEAKDVGEMHRVTNCLLQLFDRYQGSSIVIAATNFDEAIDSAMHRRFDAIVDFKMPTLDESRALFAKLGMVELWKDAPVTMSHAEIERACLVEKKARVLKGRSTEVVTNGAINADQLCHGEAVLADD